MAANGSQGSVGVQPLLRVERLRKTYAQRHPLSLRQHSVTALDGVDLAAARGLFLALVGGSGSGKSTLARCIACLERPSGGSIWFQGKDVAGLCESELRHIRPKLQLIFQDTASALNPRFSALELVEEPLRIQHYGSARARAEKALDTMVQVGMLPDCAQRYPHQFSGGQRQRLAIARALVQEPELLILDEALSGLDLSLQAQMVNTLLELRKRHDLTYLYISHDLGLVKQVADEVAVMHGGRVVERAPTAELFRSPQQPVTRELIAAIPEIACLHPAARSQ
ncbi:MAG: ATP-binding cassette domain-containing protein [Acidobacteriia bacterium]|nr:ATP-binding cassette domain-containing protein [Terriglobia bacterium]